MAKFENVGELYAAILSGEHIEISLETEALIRKKIKMREQSASETSKRIYEKVIAEVESKARREPANILEIKRSTARQVNKKSRMFTGIISLAAIALIAIGLIYILPKKTAPPQQLEVFAAGTKMTQGDITYVAMKQVFFIRQFKDNQLSLNIRAGALAVDRAETGAKQNTKTALFITTPEGSLTLHGTKFLISTDNQTTQVLLLKGSASWKGLKNNTEIPLTSKAPVIISSVQGEKQLSGKEALRAFSDYATVIPQDFKIEFDNERASIQMDLQKPNDIKPTQGFAIGQCVSFSYANDLRAGKIVKIQGQMASIRMGQMFVDINLADLAGSGSCP